MQRIGFVGMVVGMLILVMAEGAHAKSSMILVLAGFSISNLTRNMGPNSTTFSLPALLQDNCK